MHTFFSYSTLKSLFLGILKADNGIEFHAIWRFQINFPTAEKNKNPLSIICSLAKKQIIEKSHVRWTIRPESSNTLDNLTQVFGQYQ